MFDSLIPTPSRRSSRRSSQVCCPGFPSGTPVVVAAISALLACSIAACGGRGTYANETFETDATRYHVTAPSGPWQSVDVSGQNDLAWVDDAAGAVLQINSSCEAGTDVPLQALTNHLLIGFTDRQGEESTLHPMDGREALETHLVARLDGVPREMLLRVLKKDECVYDFSLISPPGPAFTAARPAFARLVESFEAEPRNPSHE